MMTKTIGLAPPFPCLSEGPCPRMNATTSPCGPHPISQGEVSFRPTPSEEPFWCPFSQGKVRLLLPSFPVSCLTTVTFIIFSAPITDLLLFERHHSATTRETSLYWMMSRTPRPCNFLTSFSLLHFMAHSHQGWITRRGEHPGTSGDTLKPNRRPLSERRPP